MASGRLNHTCQSITTPRPSSHHRRQISAGWSTSLHCCMNKKQHPVWSSINRNEQACILCSSPSLAPCSCSDQVFDACLHSNHSVLYLSKQLANEAESNRSVELSIWVLWLLLKGATIWPCKDLQNSQPCIRQHWNLPTVQSPIMVQGTQWLGS